MTPLRMVIAAATMLGASHALAHGGLVDLSVYDRADGRWLPVYWHEGRAYVVGKAGNEYQIRLRSRLREELLAVVSVDGVNVITGQTANPSQSGYVIAPRGTLDIQGWRKSLSQTAAFYFMIGIALFRKKQEPQPIAPIAPQARSESQERDSRLGTGHGRYETSYATHVTFERATSAPAEIITLYYDSHANLVARGVIRERLYVAPTPRPFPGFVPDPRG
jgi:hypothetical protein